jgi:hypothetical protein
MSNKEAAAAVAATEAVQGKLLLISDLEGCAPFSAAKQPQTQLQCSPEFFASIAAFLEEPTNKVAFLGDYFDQGPLVVDSINSIIDLYNAYGPRVHIILGNRDLNKLRLIYEMKETPQAVGEKKWAVWSKFYNELSPPAGPLSLMDRLKHIVSTSMGAPIPINLCPQDELTADETAYLLLRAFSEPAAALLPTAAASKAKIEAHPDQKYTKFIKNVRTLFTVGKIVAVDTDFKTLMSHAGGAEPFLLHNIDYYTTIKSQLLPKEGVALTYYDKIEQVRLLLQEPPTAEQQAQTLLMETYNAPLLCIPSLFDDAKPEPPDDFYLLQGLGLKPNAGKHYTSFVQSCDIQSCKGPQGPDLPLDPPLTYDAYLGLLEQTGIEAIAFGHAPHCVPIPVIYRRPESRIMFIGNDTSNGYRPAAISAINQIPLSYVSKTPEGITIAGVFSLPGTAKYTYNAGSMFASMINTWHSESCPRFLMDPPRIQYEGAALQFPARVEKAPPGIFKAATMAGGSRKKKGKNNKKYKSTLRRVNRR